MNTLENITDNSFVNENVVVVEKLEQSYVKNKLPNYSHTYNSKQIDKWLYKNKPTLEFNQTNERGVLDIKIYENKEHNWKIYIEVDTRDMSCKDAFCLSTVYINTSDNQEYSLLVPLLKRNRNIMRHYNSYHFYNQIDVLYTIFDKFKDIEFKDIESFQQQLNELESI